MDEYGVKILNIIYNRADGISFCLLEALQLKRQWKSIMKTMAVKCDWITEVEVTA
jgi:hypothetical protein